MRNNKAFTMIEILVVIAIIGLLAAVVYPMLSASSSRSREFQCESNLEQIAVAMRAYVDDYGVFPKNLSTLDKTLRDKQLLVCPATGHQYYYRAPKSDASASRVVVTCAHKGYPHRFNNCRFEVTAGGSVRRARMR